MIKRLLITALLAFPLFAQQTPIKNELLYNSTLQLDTINASTLTGNTITGGTINNVPIGLTNTAVGNFTGVGVFACPNFPIYQGLYIAWNCARPGLGAAEIFGGHGLGGEVFDVYSTPLNSSNPGTLVFGVNSLGDASITRNLNTGGDLATRNLSAYGNVGATGNITSASMTITGAASAASLISGTVSATSVMYSPLFSGALNGNATSATNAQYATAAGSASTATHASSSAALDGTKIEFIGTNTGSKTCATDPNANVCDYGFPITSPYSNTSYVPVCTLMGPYTGRPTIVGVTSRFTNAITIRIGSLDPGVSAQADSVSCLIVGAP